MKRPVGRPPGRKPQGKPLYVRLTPEQRERFERLAAKLRVTLSKLVVDMLEDCAKEFGERKGASK